MEKQRSQPKGSRSAAHPEVMHMTALIYTIVIAVLVAADQLTKRAVVSHMQLGETIPVIDGLLDWTYILNDGASFGMLGGQTVLLLVTTGLVMLAVAVALYSGKFDKHWTGTLAGLLILSGGIGNCIDRVFNEGKVVDFIDICQLFDFPKFNVADCCVTVGGVLFCIFVLFFYDDKKKETIAAAAAAAGTVGAVSAAQQEIAETVEAAAESVSEAETEAGGDDGTA